MDQQKIGKFILELRKEKNMTQIELANLLGVTDRAISKWENGRGMPDLSLIKSLCNILDITINELLSGERISKNNYQEKFEENILNTIGYTNKKIKNNNKVFKIIISIIVVLISLLITFFFIDVRRMNQNEEVLFSTWGFDYAPPVDLNAELLESTIKEYIVTKGDNEYGHYKGEKTFASIKIYLIEEIEKTYFVYAWVLEEKYYLENNIIKQSSGSSIPHKFTIKKINDEFIVSNSEIPRDGSYYKIDMKKIFPYSVRKDMDKVHQDGTIERLSLDIKEQINLYFHK